MKSQEGGLARRSSPGGPPSPIRPSARAIGGGFTLIEVLVALVVTVAALSILAQGFIAGGRASAGAQQATRAALVAQRVVADLETGAIPIDRGQAGAYPDEPDFPYETATGTFEPGLLSVSVIVRWTERNQERTYVLHRLMRERPPPP